MGHNSVVLGHPKSKGIPQVDGLSTGPPGFGHHSRHVSVQYCNVPLGTYCVVSLSFYYYQSMYANTYMLSI